MFVNSSTDTFHLASCTIAYNEGVGLLVELPYIFATADVTNCIMWNNKAGNLISVKGTEYNEIASYTLRNCLIPEGTANEDFNKSCVSGNPMFNDPEAEDFSLTWTNFPLNDSTRSSCIDNGYYLAPVDEDSSRSDIGAVPYVNPLKTQYPSARFTADTTIGYQSSLRVAFSNLSYKGDNFSKWIWDFGDGTTSSDENPVHIYQGTGIFAVKLTVTRNDGVSDSMVLPDLIRIYEGSRVNPGNVSGIWSKARSPYYVYGDIVVPDSMSLLLEPGTRVQFMGPYEISVHGQLVAKGTVKDSINFDLYDTTGNYITYAPDFDLNDMPYADQEKGWRGIHFDNIQVNNDSSFIEYCKITNVRSGSGGYDYQGEKMKGSVSSYRSSRLTIKHNLFYNNLVKGLIYNRDGVAYRISAGISLGNATPVIQYNEFNHIYSQNEGAAIYADHCDGLIFESNVFNGCYGDAVAVLAGRAKLINGNVFNGNWGCLRFYNNLLNQPYPGFEMCLLSNNLFENNVTTCIRGDNMVNFLFVKNQFIGNYDESVDPCMNVWGDSIYIVNNLFTGNTTSARFGTDGSAAINFFTYKMGLAANNTVVNNHGSVYYQTGGIYAAGNAKVINNIVRDNSLPQVTGLVSVNFSWQHVTIDSAYNNNIEGGYPGRENFDAIPGFRDTTSLDFNLTDNSPCIDMGSVNTLLASYLPLTDLAANKRIDSVSNRIDVGAYEFPVVNSAPEKLFLSANKVPVYFHAGSFIGKLSVKDKNILDQHYYSLATDNVYDNERFDISGDSLFTKTTFSVNDNDILKINVRVTDRSGAIYEQMFDITLLKSVITSVGDVAEIASWLKVYPNPVVNQLYLDVKRIIPGQLHVSIMDGRGIAVRLQTLKYGMNVIELSDLPKGIYWLTVSNDQDRYVKKIVKL